MKSETDIHWNTRAANIEDEIDVNIMDIYQRQLEYKEICPHIKKTLEVLEVGCGNGYSTSIFRELAKYIDAFDLSENMIERAKKAYGETNNTFFIDNVLEMQKVKREYDLILCIRVLCNLRNLNEQRWAINNLLPFIKTGGIFLLLEGFTDGFLRLNEIRAKAGLPKLEPAKINFYSSVDDLMPQLEEKLFVEKEIHLGNYDYLTRFVYPCLVGNENVKHNTVFHQKAATLTEAYNPDSFKCFSRLRGFVLRKK